MAADDFLESEVALVAAATAALLTPRTRAIVRRAATYGIAGFVKSGEIMADAARGAAREVGRMAPGGNAPGAASTVSRSSSRPTARATAARGDGAGKAPSSRAGTSTAARKPSGSTTARKPASSRATPRPAGSTTPRKPRASKNPAAPDRKATTPQG